MEKERKESNRSSFKTSRFYLEGIRTLGHCRARQADRFNTNGSKSDIGSKIYARSMFKGHNWLKLVGSICQKIMD